MANPQSTSGSTVDLLVVGGGILGMSVAYRAAKRGRRVVVCRQSDANEPCADTLRNQSWLQSGLRYIGLLQQYGYHAAGAAAFARRMKAAGSELHTECGRRTPSGFGIIRVRDVADERNLLHQAGSMGVRCTPLNNHRQYLGALYQPGGIYYRTPEVVFAEAELMETLRVKLHGPKLKGRIDIVNGAVSLAPSSDPGGFKATVGRVVYSAPETVIAAGVGTMPLLNALGVTSPKLAATQTPLAVIKEAVLPGVNGRARILVDRVDGFSLVSHPPSASLPHGAAVLGVRGPDPKTVFQFTPPNARRVSAQEWQDFWKGLPAALTRLRRNSRCTAGVEVFEDGEVDVVECVRVLRGFGGLVMAIPGRATMAMRVADEVVDVLDGLPPSGRPSSIPAAPPAWLDPVCMHHEPHYVRLHDV